MTDDETKEWARKYMDAIAKRIEGKLIESRVVGLDETAAAVAEFLKEIPGGVPYATGLTAGELRERGNHVDAHIPDCAEMWATSIGAGNARATELGASVDLIYENPQFRWVNVQLELDPE